ncbi:MAG TPA: SurA N-terminal domain-containing protein [Candidatus Polarisedimenticolia bacterium]|nr:SurA N-terminal domain-containing protein [Candidatus Polarisedimenticolia bacterium]
MRKELRLRRRILALAAVAACALAGSCRKEAPPRPNVWAVVNGKEILREDVDKVFKSRVNSEAPQPSQEEALSLKLSILDELINSEILVQRANKMNLVASDAEVEDKFTESKSPYTEDEFQKKLKETGLTVDDLKSEIRRELSIQKLLNREVVAKISITDKDISDFYGKNRSQFNVVEPQYHLAQIVITPRPDPTVHNRKNDKAANEAEAGRKAAMLIRRLDAGADFIELAMDYSEDASASTGGDLGFIPQSSFNRSDPALKRAVLALKPGQYTQPIQTRGGGYTILKLIAKEAAGDRQLSDPQVQQAIRNALSTRKEQLLRSAYLIEARDEAHVTNYLARQILESAGKLPEAK